MAKEGTLLIVDDNRSILAALRLLLEKYFARVLTLPTPNRLATTLREEQIDVILLDMNFTAGINTGNEGIYWLGEIHARRPDIKVVLFTAYADIDLAVRAMRDGAVDFVVKPWDNDRLVASLRNAYNLARSAREVKQLKEIKRELASEQHTPWKRFARDRPNALWQMDYKGHFGMTNGQRCHGLTILDDHSRFSLCLDAKENERWEGTKASLDRVFEEFGIPDAILCDNGAPWADNHGGYTPFEIWMMQMDVTPMHGKPGHPQTQGKDERFHRTLKEDLLLRKPLTDLAEAQKEFDEFRDCYNHERPHGALELDVPAKHYRPSRRKVVENPTEPEYDSGKNLRKVNCCGYVSVYKKRYYLSESFIGKYIELRPLEGDLLALVYGNFEIARIDLEAKKFDSRKIYRIRNV